MATHPSWKHGPTLDSSFSFATTSVGQQPTEPTPRELASSPPVLTLVIATTQATTVFHMECSKSLCLGSPPTYPCRANPSTRLPHWGLLDATCLCGTGPAHLPSLAFRVLKTQLLFPAASFPTASGGQLGSGLLRTEALLPAFPLSDHPLAEALVPEFVWDAGEHTDESRSWGTLPLPRWAPETGPGLENSGYEVATPSCQLPSLPKMVLGVRKAWV